MQVSTDRSTNGRPIFINRVDQPMEDILNE